MAGTPALVGNVVGYQAVWLASVAGAGHGLAWAGPVAALAFVAATLAWGGRRRDDARMLCLLLPVGWALDTLFAASGWLRYAEPLPSASMAPVWILALWAGFAMTMNHSMAFLRERPGAAALFGAVGGPLAYWAAARGFAAVEFMAAPAACLAALALAWALVLPGAFALDRRLRLPLALPRRAGA